MSSEPEARGGRAPSTICVGPEHGGLRADAFLALALPSLSQTRIRQKIQMGESLLNGGRYATSARLRAGDVITVFWRGAPAVGTCPPLVILYEDEHVVVVDKPAGVASHPVGKFRSGTVIQFVRDRCAAEMQASLGGDGDVFPCLVNRLDVFTSGVILAAATRRALRAMHDLARRGEIRKRYIALVEGSFSQDSGRIELALGPDPSSATVLRMAARADGLACITEYAVLERYPAHTLLAVSPLTGRQHQIRAHLAAIGHPVWGDLLYKDESLFLRYHAAGGSKDPSFPPRHCLHAAESEFTHPLTGARVVIRSPLPPDFLAIRREVEEQPHSQRS